MINASKWPWSVHGYVESVFPNNVRCRGTGTLITKSHFLTAAHCLLYVNESKQTFYPSQITFYADFDSRRKLAIRADSETFYMHPAYLEKDTNYDFALVDLGKDIGSYTGWASVETVEDTDFDQKIVNVTGYPAQKTVLDILLGRHTERMYTMSGPVVSTEKHKIYYNLDTSGGQSGAGVWYMNEEDLVNVVGIHIMGRSKVMGNAGVRLSLENITLINDWLLQANAMAPETLNNAA